MPAFQPSITRADLLTLLVARSLTAQMVTHESNGLAVFHSMTIEAHLEVDLTWTQDERDEGEKGAAAVEVQRTSGSNKSDSESEGTGKGPRLWRHMYSHSGGVGIEQVSRLGNAIYQLAASS